MARIRKFTPAVIVQIRSFVDDGLSASEIAETIGCTVGTLRVRCSQIGVSLRRTPSQVLPGRKGVSSNSPKANNRRVATGDRVSLSLQLSHTTVDQLRRRAAMKNLSESKFASLLLEIIAHDDLYDALLDDDSKPVNGQSVRR